MGLVGGTATESLQGGAAAPAEALEENGPRDMKAFFAHGVDVIQSIWKWILFGVLVSAGITVWVPAGALAGWSILAPALAGLAALSIALPLYVCATATVPIAAALVAQGMPTGAALVFLMAGPATNVATLGAVRRVFGGRVLSVYLGTVILGSLGLAALYDRFAPFSPLDPGLHQHAQPWWAWASGILLAGLFTYFATQEARAAWRRRFAPPAAVAAQSSSCGGCCSKKSEGSDPGLP